MLLEIFTIHSSKNQLINVENSQSDSLWGDCAYCDYRKITTTTLRRLILGKTMDMQILICTMYFLL